MLQVCGAGSAGGGGGAAAWTIRGEWPVGLFNADHTAIVRGDPHPCVSQQACGSSGTRRAIEHWLVFGPLVRV